MIIKIMKEVGQVATAEGYPNVITDEVIEKDLERPRARLNVGGKEPSMLTDVRFNRPIEVEAIIGNTLRLGEKHGLDTPYLELLYTLATARSFELSRPESWKPISFAKVNGQA